MHVSLLDSIDRVGRSRMELLEGSRLDFSHGLLRAMERSLWGDLTVKYLAVEEGSELLAFTPVYIGTTLNFNALLPRLFQKAYTVTVNSFGLRVAYRAAVVGCLISDRGWIPMRPHCDVKSVLALMLPEIERVARSGGADFCLIKDIHSEFKESGQFLAAGYTQMFSLPTVQAPTAFPSFEKYLQSLTKNGRKHARKTYRKAEGRLTLREACDFADLVPSVYPLFRSTFLKARYQFEELPPQFFLECARSEHPKTKLILCEKDGGIVGALLLFYDSREQLSKRIGIDYRQEETALIYNLLMYQSIRHAIEHGITRVHLGQSTYIPKIRMGGKMEDQFLFIKAFSPGLRAALPAQRLLLNRYRAEKITAEIEGNSLE